MYFSLAIPPLFTIQVVLNLATVHLVTIQVTMALGKK